MFDYASLVKMSHSHIKNYVLPGLTSSLIGGASDKGCVRMFQANREQLMEITPHSHRYTLTSHVLRGEVTNRLWRIARTHETADIYMRSVQTFSKIGEYSLESKVGQMYAWEEETYGEGQSYTMMPDDIHSIRFSRDAIVLVFEGPTVRTNSIILEPMVDGEIIPTMKSEPWMFKR